MRTVLHAYSFNTVSMFHGSFRRAYASQTRDQLEKWAV